MTDYQQDRSRTWGRSGPQAAQPAKPATASLQGPTSLPSHGPAALPSTLPPGHGEVPRPDLAAVDVGGDRLARILRLTDALQGMNSDDVYSLNIALSNAVEGIARMDFEGRFVWVNAAYCRISGYLPGDLVGRKPEEVAELVLKEDVQKHRQAQLDMLQYGRSIVDLRGKRPDGTMYWRQLTCIPASDRSGRIVGYFKFVYDITHRKRNEEAVQQMTADVIRRFQQWHKIVEVAPDAIITVNAKGEIVTWNEAAAALLGWTESSAMGKPVASMLTAGNRRPHHDGDAVPADKIAEAMVAPPPDVPLSRTSQPRVDFHGCLACPRNGQCKTIDAYIIYWPQEANQDRHSTAFIRESSANHQTAAATTHPAPKAPADGNGGEPQRGSKT